MGVGGGGGRGAGGEWWDNNKGQNYRVQFRVREGVGQRGEGGEENTLPSISPSPSPPSSSSSSTVSSGSSSPTTPTIPCSTSHSNSAHVFALEQTAPSRLRQFNLKKYAMPVSVPSVGSVAAVDATSIITRAHFMAGNDTEDKSREKDLKKAWPIPVSIPVVEGPEFEMTAMGRYARMRKSKDLRATSISPLEVTINSSENATENNKSVTPHLPWEASRPSVKTVSEERKSEVPNTAMMRDGHSAEAGTDAQTMTKPGFTTPKPVLVPPVESPFTTPRQSARSLPKEFTQAATPASGIWSTGSGKGRKRGSMVRLDTDIILPVLHETPSPLDSDSVHEALVKEWCFAGGPSSRSSARRTTL